MRVHPRLSVVLLLALLMGSATAGHAQEITPPAHVSVSAGFFQFDLAGSGWAPTLAGRVAAPFASVLMLEGSLAVARPDQDFATTTMIIPEAQVQLAIPFVSVIPYMGLGGGVAVDLRDSAAGGIHSFFTVSGSVGIKAWLGRGLGAQAEYRGRGLGLDFEGAVNEYTFGLVRRV